jgi:[acyl-carrier-protein] S-malonyltransferase
MSKKIALIFPGQGSQSNDMGKSFVNDSLEARDLFIEVSDKIGYDFKKLLFENDPNLQETKYTQPAILLISSIASNMLQHNIDIVPQFALGHSLGEFSALVSTGAIDLMDALYLVHKRGEYMEKACQNKDAGMMAVLGIEDSKLEEVLKNFNKSVWASNYNQDGQLVIGGIKSDLQEIDSKLKEAGAKKCVLLNMSVASHCPLLEEARADLDILLDKFIKDSFAFDIISNVTSKAYNSKKEALELLSRQLVEPVLYKQSIQNYANNVDCFVELGHGKVLAGLNKRVCKEKQTLNIFDTQSLKNVIKELEG